MTTSHPLAATIMNKLNVLMQGDGEQEEVKDYHDDLSSASSLDIDNDLETKKKSEDISVMPSYSRTEQEKCKAKGESKKKSEDLFVLLSHSLAEKEKGEAKEKANKTKDVSVLDNAVTTKSPRRRCTSKSPTRIPRNRSSAEDLRNSVSAMSPTRMRRNRASAEDVRNTVSDDVVRMAGSKNYSFEKTRGATNRRGSTLVDIRKAPRRNHSFDKSSADHHERKTPSRNRSLDSNSDHFLKQFFVRRDTSPSMSKGTEDRNRDCRRLSLSPNPRDTMEGGSQHRARRKTLTPPGKGASSMEQPSRGRRASMSPVENPAVFRRTTGRRVSLSPVNRRRGSVENPRRRGSVENPRRRGSVENPRRHRRGSLTPSNTMENSTSNHISRRPSMDNEHEILSDEKYQKYQPGQRSLSPNKGVGASYEIAPRVQASLKIREGGVDRFRRERRLSITKNQDEQQQCSAKGDSDFKIKKSQTKQSAAKSFTEQVVWRRNSKTSSKNNRRSLTSSEPIAEEVLWRRESRIKLRGLPQIPSKQIPAAESETSLEDYIPFGNVSKDSLVSSLNEESLRHLESRSKMLNASFSNFADSVRKCTNEKEQHHKQKKSNVFSNVVDSLVINLKNNEYVAGIKSKANDEYGTIDDMHPDVMFEKITECNNRSKNTSKKHHKGAPSLEGSDMRGSHCVDKMLESIRYKRSGSPSNGSPNASRHNAI